MGKKEKIFRKAKDSPNNLSYSDLCSLAKHVGFLYRDSKGDHETYKHPNGGMMNFQSVKGQAKPYQIRQLLDFIDENELMEE